MVIELTFHLAGGSHLDRQEHIVLLVGWLKGLCLTRMTSNDLVFWWEIGIFVWIGDSKYSWLQAWEAIGSIHQTKKNISNYSELFTVNGVCVCWNSSNIRIEKEERIALVPLYSDGCCILNSATLEKSVLQGSVVQAHIGRFVADSPNNQPKLLWSFRRTIDVPLVSLILFRRSPLIFFI